MKRLTGYIFYEENISVLLILKTKLVRVVKISLQKAEIFISAFIFNIF